MQDRCLPELKQHSLLPAACYAGPAARLAAGHSPSYTVPMIFSAAEKKPPIGETLAAAAHKAMGGGLAGAGAMAINVGALMWMRTTVNYQYRYGMGTTEALKHLYNDGGRGLGGIARFYRGLLPALVQGPISRFGDTAANVGMLALWDSMEETQNLPTAVKTVTASAAAAGFRIFLMPVDACKTIMQVEGKGGFQALMQKVRVGGPSVMWHGALGASAATFVGHYPWFFTYNTLNELLPKYDRNTELPMYLARSAVIGFGASAVSDTCSNSIRVIKVFKQASTVSISYPQVVKEVIKKDGVSGLLFRGLTTKIISNGMQGLMFSVLWRLLQDKMAQNNAESTSQPAKTPAVN
eukprot:CAMPEP_0197859576 /NCGR_PEP_ID=MMETSP1438-20131217/34227_1 /TAXON_ID=1461541 /ORGANISM="Pterosperma sp., Strain CCMP1384" /LENGTH=351 /DNA_ID=CAMNT_0043476107 /DNA_START=241 /DNA_END=1296 /DNA_ORIENTATION=-